MDEVSKILFEPTQFLTQEPNPNKHEYKLELNILEYWAIEGTEIRLRFRDKADTYGRIFDNIQAENTNNVRTRRGMRLSVAS